ncbi:MAG: Crp/Fnr family transcriptional regulator [Actinomycetota bacterium]|nr:Crp/Fnr family transcriptional regulator [Actinomycetota bacterium]
MRVLDEAPQLIAELDPSVAQAAREHCVARKALLEEGRWVPPSDGEARRGWLGLLVLDGLLARAVDIRGLRAQELLGPGDVLRPWDDESELGPVPAATAWTVLQPTTIALLDRRFTIAAARWPGIMPALLRASVQRSHSRSLLLAVAQARRADHRLLLLFSHLADRWGRVTPAGVWLPLRLTHERLGELVCLRRPTVSMTLRDLRDRGELGRRPDGSWFLPGPAWERLRQWAPEPEDSLCQP